LLHHTVTPLYFTHKTSLVWKASIYCHHTTLEVTKMSQHYTKFNFPYQYIRVFFEMERGQNGRKSVTGHIIKLGNCKRHLLTNRHII